MTQCLRRFGTWFGAALMRVVSYPRRQATTSSERQVGGLRVACVHLLNDYSGSPRVLSQVVMILRKRGAVVDIIAGGDPQHGFLSGLDAHYRWIAYSRSANPAVQHSRFLLAQVQLAWHVLSAPRYDVVYINTILPFAAALAARARRSAVVYHIHETSIRPSWFKRLLMLVAHNTSSKEIYVSDYLMNAERSHAPAVRIYNALSKDFAETAAAATAPQHREPFVVVMLCSLRDYKGVPEFLRVAKMFEADGRAHFELVLNATKSELSSYFASVELPSNLRVHAAISDVRSVYARASLVVNMSRPREWTETFGLTLLEAMSYGVPVVGPPVGGPAEIIEDGVSGFLVPGSELERFREVILALIEHPSLYRSLSNGARKRALSFSPEEFERGILAAVRS